MSQLVKLDISGDNPTDHAQRILQQYSKDEAIKSISLKITTADSGAPETRQMTAEDYDLTGGGEDDEKTTEEREAEKEAKREKGDIKANTSHHRVLYTLGNLGNGNMVPGRKVKEAVEGVSESSVYPALTQLWERKLAERERVEDVANPFYKYTLSQYGRHKLEDLGKPEPTEDE